MDISHYKTERKIELLIRVAAVLFSLFLFIAHYWAVFYYVSRVNDGIAGINRNDSIVIENITNPDLRDQINIGDEIIAINGISVARYLNTERWVLNNPIYAPAELQDGETQRYLIRSDGEESEVILQLQKIDLLSYFTQHWLEFLGSFLIGMTGLFVLLRKPNHKIAQILYFLTQLFTLVFPLLPVYVTAYSDQLSAIIIITSRVFLVPLLQISIAFFIFNFPYSSFTKNRRWLLYFLLFGPLVVLNMYILVSLLVFGGFSNFPFWHLLAYNFSIVVLALGMAFMFIKYWRIKEPIYKAQMKWLLWGLGVAVIPYSLLYGFTWLVFNRVLLTGQEMIVFFSAFPISVAFAITKTRLFQIDRVINKSLVYVLLSAILVGLYVLLAVSLSVVFSSQYSITSSTVISSISAAFTMLLLNPIHYYTQRFVNRVFYRQQFESTRFVHDITEKLATATTYDQINVLATKEVINMLMIDQCWLLIREGLSEELILLSTDGEKIKNSELASRLQGYHNNQENWQGEVIDPQNVDTRDLYYEKGVRIIVPLLFNGQLAGFYLIGSKKSEVGFTVNELDAIEAVSYPLAIAIVNAQSYEMLQHEKQRIENIIQSVSETVISIDEKGIVVDMNKEGEKLWKLSRDEAIGKHYRDVVTFYNSENSIEDTDLIKNTLDFNKTVREMCWLQSSLSGSERKVPVSVNITPIASAEGVSGGVIITIYDRTEEQELLSAKDAFLGTVSHELNTPAGIIRDYCEVIKRQIENKDYEEAEFSIGVLSSTAWRLVSKVEQIIELSKYRSGKQVISYGNVAVAELSGYLEKKYRKRAELKKIEWVSDIDDEVKLYTDVQILKKILAVLVDNAIAFTERGMVKFSIRQEDKEVVLEVVDTGTGIDQYTLAKLFQPFIQQGGPMHRIEQAGGLGLGLSLVKTLADLIDVRIKVDSDVGVGTSFKLIFQQ